MTPSEEVERARVSRNMGAAGHHTPVSVLEQILGADSRQGGGWGWVGGVSFPLSGFSTRTIPAGKSGSTSTCTRSSCQHPPRLLRRPAARAPAPRTTRTSCCSDCPPSAVVPRSAPNLDAENTFECDDVIRRARTSAEAEECWGLPRTERALLGCFVQPPEIERGGTKQHPPVSSSSILTVGLGFSV